MIFVWCRKIIDEACAVAKNLLEQATHTQKEAEANVREAEQKMRESEAKMRESEAEMRESEAKIREAQAEMREAQAKMIKAETKMREAEAELKDTATKHISETVLYNEARRKCQECTSQVSLCKSEVLKSTGSKIHFCKFLNVY